MSEPSTLLSRDSSAGMVCLTTTINLRVGCDQWSSYHRSDFNDTVATVGYGISQFTSRRTPYWVRELVGAERLTK